MYSARRDYTYPDPVNFLDHLQGITQAFFWAG
jgi:hypothetical protein